MNIENRKNGTYRIRQMYKGKTYTVTLDHKPTQKEATILLAEVMNNSPAAKTPLTVSEAVDSYIADKENILAVSTIRGYRVCQRNMPEGLATSRLFDLDSQILQRYASEMISEHSVKYTKNIMGLVKSVLATYRPDFTFRIKYPTVTQKDTEIDYMPTAEDIRRIIQESEGTKYEIALLLCASYGLRRGEVCALQLSDLSDDNYLTVNKDMVQDDKNEWHIKPPKTKTSVRTLYIQPFIADKIRAQGYIFDGKPFQIYDWLKYTQNKLGIPHFTLHKLRHFFCSELSASNVDEATILKLGGWSDPSVMKRVYRHAKLDDDKMKMASKISTAWSQDTKKIISKKDLMEIVNEMPEDASFEVVNGLINIRID